MLEGDDYSFGKIYVHQTVLAEISEWEYSGAKKNKFGLGVIKSMITKCEELVLDGPTLADEEKNKIFRRISRVEQQLADEQKSSDTSEPDKMYLAVAHKLRANLATQERTLRSVSKKVIGEDRLFSFADMIIDRCEQKLIDKKKVEEGVDNLAYFDESFIRGNKKRILEEIKKL